MTPANVTEQGWQEMARERFLAGPTLEIPVGKDGPMLENPWKSKSMFEDICGMAQKYNRSKSLFLFSSIFRLR